MIDTIVIRIHNIKSYRLLYEQFQTSSRKKNSIVEGTAVVDQDGTVTEGYKIWQRITAFEDTGKFMPHNIRFDINSPSSVYDVRGCLRGLDTDKAFLEIEFSLPKYFYGTNVFQLLGSPARSSEANFYYLLKAIKRFFQSSFNQIPSDFDVEIFRIDMCYNQFHKSKKDAFDYLDAQRDWMKKYCDGRNMRLVDSYASTWTVITARYSFKCYHKGTEFYENDYKELVKRMHLHKYDLKRLQDVSDLILRYEITYRRSMLNYLTMYYTFQDLEKKAGYMLNSNLFNYVSRVSKVYSTGKVSNDVLRGSFKSLSPVDFFISKQKQFRLKSDFDRTFSAACIFGDAVSFDYKVYRLLYDWFWSKVKLSQPDEAMPIAKMVDSINGYQKKLKMRRQSGSYRKDSVKRGNLVEVGKKNVARLLVPALLSQYVDLRTLKNFIPQATYYRLMKDFKLAGLPLKNGKVLLSRPPLDYVDNAALLEPMKKNFIL